MNINIQQPRRQKSMVFCALNRQIIPLNVWKSGGIVRLIKLNRNRATTHTQWTLNALCFGNGQSTSHSGALFHYTRIECGTIRNCSQVITLWSPVPSDSIQLDCVVEDKHSLLMWTRLVHIILSYLFAFFLSFLFLHFTCYSQYLCNESTSCIDATYYKKNTFSVSVLDLDLEIKLLLEINFSVVKFVYFFSVFFILSKRRAIKV